MMRIRWAFGAWWLVLTLAWAAAAQPWQGLASSADPAFWWQLRRHLLYLSGIWSLGMMSLVMWLSLRQRWMDRVLGGMDQVYRLHKWGGIAAALTAMMHWTAEQSGSWIRAVWGRAGRRPREPVLDWVAGWRDLAEDVGEWAFYAMLVMVVLTLWQRLLPYRPWRRVHRVMPVLYLLLVCHATVLMPLSFWQAPLGALMAGLMGVGSVAASWSLAGRIGRRRSHVARVHSVKVLGPRAGTDPLEVLCAMPASWPGHRPGQFVFASFDGLEGPHPFTIASAPDGCGRTAAGEPLLRLVIKPLGDYTRVLHERVHPGQAVRIEGPYGQFDAQGDTDKVQVWIAGGVGITPFLALLQARQPGLPRPAGLAPAHLHYCTRDAARDPLLPQVQALCQAARPPVHLHVHDAAQGKLLQPADLARHGRQLDLWLCGPAGLGQAIRRATRQQRGWRLHQEAFEMR
jgi:predicted ferric reductase